MNIIAQLEASRPVIDKELSRKLHTREDIEDVSQDVLVKAIVRLETYRGSSDISEIHRWLVGIARHAALDHIRRSKRRPSISLDSLENPPEPGYMPEEFGIFDVLHSLGDIDLVAKTYRIDFFARRKTSSDRVRLIRFRKIFRDALSSLN